MKTLYWVIIAVIVFIYCRKNTSQFGASKTTKKASGPAPSSADIIKDKQNKLNKIKPVIENACKSVGLKYYPPTIFSSTTTWLGLGHCN